MFCAAFDRTASYRQSPLAEHGVLHPKRVGCEIAAFALQHLEGVRIRRERLLEQGQQWLRPVPPQQVFGMFSPAGSFERAVPMEHFSEIPEVLGPVPPI